VIHPIVKILTLLNNDIRTFEMVATTLTTTLVTLMTAMMMEAMEALARC